MRIRLLLSGVLAWSPVGCGQGLATLGDPDATLHCRDLAAPEDAKFAALFDIVSDAASPTGCAACHNERTPLWGYDFSRRGPAYDALSTKTAVIYGQVAAGLMPAVLLVDETTEDPTWIVAPGEPWSETELQLLRSWWCYGGFHD